MVTKPDECKQINLGGFLSPEMFLLLHSQNSQPSYALFCALSFSPMIQSAVQAFIGTKADVDKSFRVIVAFSWGQ